MKTIVLICMVCILLVYNCPAQLIYPEKKNQSSSSENYVNHLTGLQLRPKKVTEYSSNAKLKLDSVIWDVYFEDYQQTKPLEKWVFGYNEEQEPQEAKYYWYNTLTDKYIPEEHFEVFSITEDTVEVNVKYYNNDNWENFSKRHYTYDSLNNLSQIIFYSWLGYGYWDNNVKYLYEYDRSGNLINCLKLYWDYSNEEWANISLDEYLYDANNLKEHNHFIWNKTVNNWLLQEINEYTYDTTGFSTINTFNALDDTSIVITYIKEYKNEIDENHNLINFSSFRWNVYGNNEWTESRKIDYSYDNTYERIDLAIPDNKFWTTNSMFHDYFDFDFFTHKIDEISRFLYSHFNWIDDGRAKFYYSEVIQTGFPITESSEIIIYPNPSNDFIKITWNNNQEKLNLRIYNFSGAIIHNQYIQDNTIVPIADLSKGIYLLELSDNKKTRYTSKLVVQ